MASCTTDFFCNLKQARTQLALILYLPLNFTCLWGRKGWKLWRIGGGRLGVCEEGEERTGVGSSKRVGSGRNREK